MLSLLISLSLVQSFLKMSQSVGLMIIENLSINLSDNRVAMIPDLTDIIVINVCVCV